MLRMLVDRGLLRIGDDGGWRVEGDLSEVGIPLTLEALLTARLETLESGERTVIECASVIGEEFWPAAIMELVPEPESGAVSRHLGTLDEKDLVVLGGQSFAGENAYRFGHIMIRDVAYGNLLKEARSSLHERFANWLEERVGKRIGEYAEIVGYHLERAFRAREELAPVDAEGRTLASRAFGYLSVAGTDAHARGDMPAAMKLLDRSLALLPEGDPGGLDLSLKLAQACFHVGDFSRAAELCAQTATRAADRGDRRLALHARLEHADIETWTDPARGLDELHAIAEEGVTVFDELEDDLGLARSWRALSIYHSDAGRAGEATAALECALRFAQSAGDPELYTQILGGLCIAICHGPMHVREGVARLERVMESSEAAEGANDKPMIGIKTRALLEGWGLAELWAMEGDFEAARRLYGDALHMTEELGQRLRTAALGIVGGRIEMLAAAPGPAEREFRRCYETLEQMGDKMMASWAAAELSDCLYEQGRFDEAERYAGESKRLGGPDDVDAQIRWRSAQAKVLARRGHLQRAERLVGEAGRLLETFEDPNLQATGRLAQAEVARLGGRREAAELALRSALSCYQTKGNVIGAQRTTRALEELAAAERPQAVG
jgi:tetratricopeptide (TPR) repeat protein